VQQSRAEALDITHAQAHIRHPARDMRGVEVAKVHRAACRAAHDMRPLAPPAHHIAAKDATAKDLAAQDLGALNALHALHALQALTAVPAPVVAAAISRGGLGSFLRQHGSGVLRLLFWWLCVSYFGGFASPPLVVLRLLLWWCCVSSFGAFVSPPFVCHSFLLCFVWFEGLKLRGKGNESKVGG